MLNQPIGEDVTVHGDFFFSLLDVLSLPQTMIDGS